MRLAHLLVLGGVGLALTASPAWSADPVVGLPGQPPCPTYQPIPYPNCPTIPVVPPPPAKEPAKEPKKEPKKEPEAQPAPEQAAQAPTSDAFSQAPQAGTEAASSFAPQMIGDFPGILARTVTSLSPSSSFSSSSSFGSLAPSSHGSNVTIPYFGQGTFKVADNESPQTQDRFFINYNYFNDLNGSVPGGGPNFHLQLNRETIGFEKTFLDGLTSVGLRVPVFQSSGSVPVPAGVNGDIGESDVGDLTFLFKFALLNDRVTGDSICGGLAVTVPTGPGVQTAVGDIHPTLLQPFVGFLFNLDRFYVLGFSSYAIACDSRDVNMWFNDLGAGYYLVRSRDPGTVITGIAPTVEAHVDTPTNHSNLNSTCPIVAPEAIVDLTAGIHFEFFTRARLTFAASTPISGPRPFDWEGYVQLNIGF